jgi:acyl carrier protein
MTASRAEEVRLFVLDRVKQPLAAKGLTPGAAPQDLDLLSEGMIDSFGIVELIGDLEDRFRVRLDFDDLDPEVVTVVGPLSEYVAGLVEREP